MRFCRTFGTSAMFLSAVCWSFSDAPMFHFPTADTKSRISINEGSGLSLQYFQQFENALSDENKSSLSYPLSLWAFGTKLKVQVSIPSAEEQIVEMDLTSFQQQKNLSARASSHLEEFLSLVSKHHSVVRIHFSSASQRVKVFSGKFSVETEITIKETERNDLPVLLEEDTLTQLSRALECAQNVDQLAEHEKYPCYSGYLSHLASNQLLFEPRPEYQPVPVTLLANQSGSSLQFPLSATTHVVLALNSDGTIDRGDSYFSDGNMDSGTPRMVPGKKKKKGKAKNSDDGGQSKKTVVIHIGVSSVSSLSNPSGSAGGSGQPPRKPNNDMKDIPADAVIFDDEEEEEEGEEQKEQMSDLEWALQFEWPSSGDSGYSDSDGVLDVDTPTTDHKSQWGNGELRSAGQQNRANKDYVNAGRRQKDRGSDDD